jgi:hypothetical protein
MERLNFANLSRAELEEIVSAVFSQKEPESEQRKGGKTGPTFGGMSISEILQQFQLEPDELMQKAAGPDGLKWQY